MEKQFYAVYLNPLRPDFATTMTEGEREINRYEYFQMKAIVPDISIY